MHAFEIYLNRKKLSVIGVGDDGVLSAGVTWVGGRRRNQTRLYTGGLITSLEEHVKWNDVQLHAGDEVKIKVCEVDKVDPPTKRHRPDPVEQMKWQKQELRRLARKFGWKIQTRPGK